MLVLIASLPSFAQTSQRSVVIGTMTSKPDAVLVLNPTDNNQGFLLPQLSTSSRLSMQPASPDEDGLAVFDITEKEFYYWKDNAWVKGLGASPKVQYDGIDPSDFAGLRTVTKTDRTNALIFEDNNTYITAFKRDEGTSFVAPIHLPDGALLQEVTLFYMDRDVPNITLNIYRRPFAGNNESIVPTWTSTGTSAAIQQSTHTIFPDKGVIDNGTYTYRIVIKLDPSQDVTTSSDANQRIYGLKVKYLK